MEEFLFIVIAILIVVIVVLSSQYKKEKKELNRKQNIQSKEFELYKEKTEGLRKYEYIKDIDEELAILKNLKEEELNKTVLEADKIRSEARSEAKEIKDKAEIVLGQAHSLASKIEADAKKKAEEIAGEAWEAKKNADQYSETVKAMKNIINGYGDEYLIPNHSLLDELAEEYSHKEAGQKLAQIRILIKSMIKNGEAADCDYAEASRKTTAIEFVLDAFNGKVDTVMSKVKHDNYGKMLQALKDAFHIVNHNGKSFRNARITERYFETIVEELQLAVTVQELKKKDVEEQRYIQQLMRDEEKARREFEKALKEAEKEEKILQKALKEAEEKLLQSAAEEKEKLEAELAEIKLRLKEAEERGQRALSMAQQTKRGHVYVISNIGSFGENIYKIGLTRRLDPLDRVKELGDASVPFAFDVHAMIHSEDAPKLEKELHDTFENNRLNKVNYKKEFFAVKLDDIKSRIESMEMEIHWTMKAEAAEFRESLEMRKREKINEN